MLGDLALAVGPAGWARETRCNLGFLVRERASLMAASSAAFFSFLLAFFFVFAYLLKREYWKDVH